MPSAVLTRFLPVAGTHGWRGQQTGGWSVPSSTERMWQRRQGHGAFGVHASAQTCNQGHVVDAKGESGFLRAVLAAMDGNEASAGPTCVLVTTKQSALNRPPATQPRGHQHGGHSVLARKVRDSATAAVEYDHDGAASIVRLDTRARPPAVTGLVVPIDIDAIESQTIRACAHVFKEGAEVSHPLVTHSDASPTVESVRRITGVTAAGLRGLPRAVLPSPGVIGRMPMPEVSVLANGAAARLGMATPEVVSLHDGFATARASADPVGRPVRRSAKGRKVVECLATQVCSSHSSKHNQSIAAVGVD